MKSYIAMAYGNVPRAGEAARALIRAAEHEYHASASVRFAILARYEGRVIGFSEGVWDPSEPLVVASVQAAVDPQWRQQGLESSLFHLLMGYVREAKPSVEAVRLTISDNAAALADRMERRGFAVHHTETVWECARQSVAMVT